jgi:hypothetical protein
MSDGQWLNGYGQAFWQRWRLALRSGLMRIALHFDKPSGSGV